MARELNSADYNVYGLLLREDNKQHRRLLKSDQESSDRGHSLDALQLLASCIRFQATRFLRFILLITGLGAAVISKRYAESRDSREF